MQMTKPPKRKKMKFFFAGTTSPQSTVLIQEWRLNADIFNGKSMGIGQPGACTLYTTALQES